PFIGLAFIFVQILIKFAECLDSNNLNESLSKFLLVILIFIVSFLGIKTFQRNYIWQTEVRLWQDAVNKYPESVRAITNLANALSRNGQYQVAIKYYEQLKKIGNSEYATYQLFYCFLKLQNSEKVKFYLNEML